MTPGVRCRTGTRAPAPIWAGAPASENVAAGPPNSQPMNESDPPARRYRWYHNASMARVPTAPAITARRNGANADMCWSFRTRNGSGIPATSTTQTPGGRARTRTERTARRRVCTDATDTKERGTGAAGSARGGCGRGAGAAAGWRSKCTGVLTAIGITSAKWHATRWPMPRSSSSGSSVAHLSCAFGQRVRNRQPDGGLIGDGTSPSSTTR